MSYLQLECNFLIGNVCVYFNYFMNKVEGKFVVKYIESELMGENANNMLRKGEKPR